MIASVSAASSLDCHRRRGSLDGMSATPTGLTNTTPTSTSGNAFSATPGASSGFGRSANIRRRSSLLRKRLPNKSSPHVGWFRHAPPSASAATRRGTSRVAHHGAAIPTSTSSTMPAAHPSSVAKAKDMLRSSRIGMNSSNGSNLYGPLSLHMETSPFIGWFRHAPPSGMSMLKKRTWCSNSSITDLLGPSDGTPKKHIKITPPSASSLHSTEGKENRSELSSAELLALEAFFEKIGDSSSSFFVDGRLPGGHPLDGSGSSENTDYESTFPPLTFLDQRISSSLQNPSTRSTATKSSSSHTGLDDAASCSTSTTAFAGNADTPSATYGILDRLIHWLLFPLVTDSVADAGLAFNAYDSRLGSGFLQAILPFFSSLLKKHLLLENGANEVTLQQSGNCRTTQSCPDDSISSSYSDEDSSCSSSDDDSDADGLHSPLATSPLEHADGGLSQLVALDVSVSSLAERYYAHEAFKELVGSQSIPSSTVTGASSAGDANTAGNAAPVGSPTVSQQESIDYVITQIDIARMVRNASRHLDVESILSLPTMTYVSEKKAAASGSSDSSLQDVPLDDSQGDHKQTQASTSNDTQDEDLNWSWMMVPGEMDDIDLPKPSVSAEKVKANVNIHQGDEDNEEAEEGGQLISDIDEDTCVICLEHFVDGDRLRVLPCKHLFHVGCIDKWLSGSFSEEDCFTHGCPTCKKHPVQLKEEEEVVGASNDGSVPSWAFARLGDALASSGSTLSR